ncbi:MAG TPA: hypothetical protein VF155_07495 [Candidatus Dormibacteraeota bacterium]
MGHDVLARLRFASLVLLALIGTLFGHAVEYGIAAGWRGVEMGLWGPAHSYMVPAAAILVAVSFLLALRIASAARLARRRADRLWLELRGGVRDGAPAEVRRRIAAEPHPLGLFIGVGLAQVTLYLLQENIEAVVSGLPAPGFGAISGAHLTAPLVQLTFAAWLTLAWVTVSRLLRRRVAALDRIESVFRAIRRRRRLVLETPPIEQAAPASCWSPGVCGARAPPSVIAA